MLKREEIFMNILLLRLLQRISSRVGVFRSDPLFYDCVLYELLMVGIVGNICYPLAWHDSAHCAMRYDGMKR